MATVKTLSGVGSSDERRRRHRPNLLHGAVRCTGAAALIGLIYVLPVPLYLDLLAVGLVAWMVRQYRTGRHELLSLRNIFLLGFVLFEIYSVANVASTGNFGQFPLNTPLVTERRFELLAAVFLIVFLLAYERPIGFQGVAARFGELLAGRRSQRRKVVPLAIGMTGAAIMLRAFAVTVPSGTASHAASLIAAAAAAVACGLGAWVSQSDQSMARRGLFCIVILVINIPVAIVGQFSRRPLVALFGAVIWSLYYSRLRLGGSRKVILKLGVLIIIPVMALAVFTDLRQAGPANVTVSSFLNKLGDASGATTSGAKTLATNLPTGSVTLWVEENYPKNFHARRLQTLQYFFGIAIPRGIWHSKPKPISDSIANEANLVGVNVAKIKVPAGIIGNAAAEGGLFADIVYAFLIGALLRMFDDAVLRNRMDPFLVVAVGSSLGQVLGLARGESSVFAAVFVASVLVTRLALAAIEWTISFGQAPVPGRRPGDLSLSG
jgi:hypothetical protein